MVVRLWIYVVLSATRRRQRRLARGLPAHGAHVRAVAGAADRVVVRRRRRFQRWRRAVCTRVRRDGWARAAHRRRVGLRRERGRGPGARLHDLAAQVWRHVHVGHIAVVGRGAVQAGHDGHAGCRRQRDGAVVGRRRAQRRRRFGVVLAVGPRRARLVGRARRQGGSRGRGGLFDGAGMVVLVAGERGTAGECLLAVGVWAFVGPLARMYPSMSSQRARVTERLRGALAAIHRRMRTQSSHLSTPLAHVRLLSRVHALMDRQCRALDELLAAVGVVADVRTDAGMDSFCVAVSELV